MARPLREELFFAASLRKCKFLLRQNKCLECSETQEYAKKISEIFVRVAAKTFKVLLVMS